MEFKTTKTKLLNVLNKVRPGIAQKGIVEQATHFMFLGKYVATFSDQLAVIHPFKTDFPFSVKGEEFYKIINDIKEEELTLSLNDNEIQIDSEETNAGISIILDDKDKIEKTVILLRNEMKEWIELPEDFLDGLYLTMFSAAKDLSMGTLSCISIQGDKIFSGDSLRASWYTLSSPISTFLIPAKDVQELVKFGSLTHYCESDNWIHFKNKDNVSFSIKKVLGKFANIQKRFKVEGHTLELPKELAEIMKSISFFAETDIETEKIVSLTIKNNKILCKAKKEVGWIQKTIKFNYSDEPLYLEINPVFLSQILSKANKMTLCEHSALFEIDNFKHIVLLPELEERETNE